MAYPSRSAVLKREIEEKLGARIPSALSPQAQQAPRLMASGVSEVDALLGGGLPLGGITEFTGLASGGRTSLGWSVLAGASRDSACAYVDVSDSLDARSGAAAGVCLRNLLWVRMPATKALAEAVIAPVAASVGAAFRGKGALQGHHCGGHHPRMETKGMGEALGKILEQKAEARLVKMEGTPGYPNRRLGLESAPEEQVRYEHFNARRADDSDPIRQADRKAAAEARQRAQAAVVLPAAKTMQHKPWSRLDQAIRATDQILQSGGFRVVVLDLASVPHEHAYRIPSATWFRFRRAAQESDAILLLLTQGGCARSSAVCVLDCMSGLTGLEGSNVFSGFSHTAEVSRQRLSSPLAKKAPGRAVTWAAAPVWMRGSGR